MSTLIVNTNSYVTMEEADNYVMDNYLSTSPEYSAWFDADRSDNDKIVALISSAKALNNLRYKGKKAVAGQPLAFPRTFSTFPGMIYLPYVSQYSDSSLLQGAGGGNGLNSAKEAQIVNAVSQLSANHTIVADVIERTVSGVRAKKSGSVSESYDTNTSRTTNLLVGIYNQDKVFYILNAWLTDSVFSL